MIGYPDQGVDLRSDALTLPTAPMWEAMRKAHLGWATRGEDQNVCALEAEAAALTGKESALLVPTGSTANLIALMSQTRRGDQIVLEASSHILWSEEWGFAYICGLVARPVQGVAGYLEPAMIRGAIANKRFDHRPTTSLVVIENSHNLEGGAVLNASQMEGMASAAHDCRALVHLDGARIGNAAQALEQDIASLVSPVDTVCFSLNKGLSCPGGAILCGPAAVIEVCRTNLRRLGGGGLHQLGLFAAAGLVALRTMMPQLAQDNRRARTLGGTLEGLARYGLRPRAVQTNIIMADVDPERITAACLLERMAGQGIRASLATDCAIRFVVHRHITDEDVERVATVMEGLVKSL